MMGGVKSVFIEWAVEVMGWAGFDELAAARSQVTEMCVCGER